MPSPRLSTPITLLGLLLAVPGCMFYMGDDDDTCQYGGAGDGSGGGAGAAYDPGQRNPDTGECVYFGGGGGGGGGCGDPCNPCPAGNAEDSAQAPIPTWGYCESQCTGLDESSCLQTSACRAIYIGGETVTYSECWAVDQSGPIEGGGCEGLDATTCSMHDDCSAVHQSTCDTGGGAAGQDAALACGVGIFGYCMPEGPACDTPGCADPGECEGDVTCGLGPPTCPEGSTPGIRNGCFTGACIALEDCAGAPACAEIFDEPSCVERQDCTPIYQGVDCSCEADAPDNCTCADWVFTSCE